MPRAAQPKAPPAPPPSERPTTGRRRYPGARHPGCHCGRHSEPTDLVREPTDHMVWARWAWMLASIWAAPTSPVPLASSASSHDITISAGSPSGRTGRLHSSSLLASSILASELACRRSAGCAVPGGYPPLLPWRLATRAAHAIANSAGATAGWRRRCKSTTPAGFPVWCWTLDHRGTCRRPG
jgi:hypothetical protein